MLKLLREQYESTGSKHLSKLIRPSSSLYAHRFGSWIRALELAGITTTRNKKSSP
ncbi:homing endonuclease associated repeat-containing protein [Paenibacillus sp. GCM10012307]|uniref:homing endonuclease associated repeat-containing protein n=1 Tax=Paenibacillus TaxID=44249 RepID=UPI0034DD2F06